MKKILILIVIFLGSFLLFSKIHSQQKANVTTSKIISIQKDSPATSTPIPIKPVGIPQTISIPALGVNAPIEQTGLDSEGRMGVPQTDTDTAWYKYGFRPGEKGSAVIDGHFDTVTGAPAVFYNISHLKPGDTILVTDNTNNTYTFTVTQVASYPYDQLPMQQIFASNDMGRLNLITCDGTWNRSAHNYSNRAVIYSTLQTE